MVLLKNTYDILCSYELSSHVCYLTRMTRNNNLNTNMFLVVLIIILDDQFLLSLSIL